MNPLHKLQMLAQVIKWRMTWDKKDLDYRVRGIDNPKFMSPREAAKHIPDNCVLFTSGMAGNTRPSVIYWAIRDRFLTEQHPRGITHVTVGAQGSRGRVPGTMEEIALDGLCERYIGGHLETAKAQLKLADQGKLKLHTMAQGIQCFLLEAMAQGKEYIEHTTGVDTFLDPRVGTGTAVAATREPGYSEAAGDKLRYRLPKIDVAAFTIPACDREGNLYIKGACLHTEAYYSALAAKANGGIVMASPAMVIEKDPANIFLPADKVDIICVHPYNEQTGSVAQRKAWKMFTQGAHEDLEASINKLRYANQILKITPLRGEVENSLARMGANVFTRYAKRGANIVVGVGLPEEVSRLIYQGGLFDQVQFISETGVMGGLPAPGIFFGIQINPTKIVTSTEIFHYCYKNLDVALLGLLEADSQGNVNVSKRGEGAINYVGPGGFPDFCMAAKTIIFVGSWMAHSRMRLDNGTLIFEKRGECKFKDKVEEVTFSGRQALKQGKNVLYVTNVGVFKLTEEGMTLMEVMPGVDIRKDILDGCPMKVVLPKGEVPLVRTDVVTGKGFRLSFD